MDAALLEAFSMLQFAGLTCITAAVYIWYQGRQIDAGCPRCDHCKGIQRAKLEAAEKKARASKARHHSWMHQQYGLTPPTCPYCQQGDPLWPDREE